MPAKLFKQIHDALKAQPNQFPTSKLQFCVDESASQIEKPAEKTAFSQTIAPITELLDRYRNGIEGHERGVIASLFKAYLNVEKVTQQKTIQIQIQVQKTQKTKKPKTTTTSSSMLTARGTRRSSRNARSSSRTASKTST